MPGRSAEAGPAGARESRRPVGFPSPQGRTLPGTGPQGVTEPVVLGRGARRADVLNAIIPKAGCRAHRACPSAALRRAGWVGIWFGLTPRQEARLGLDAATRVGAVKLLLQCKVSGRVVGARRIGSHAFGRCTVGLAARKPRSLSSGAA